MITIPLEPFYVWALIFIRVTFVLAFFPILGDAYLPVRVRMLMGMAVAAVMAPVAHFGPEAFPANPGAFIMCMVSEAGVGLALGTIGRIMFAIVQFAGQLAGEQMGFGMVNAIDPGEQSEVSVVAEIQYLSAIILFYALDMHHVLFMALARSYELLGPGEAVMTQGASLFMVKLGTMVYALSVRFAMPVLTTIFAIHVSLGLVNKAVPQINVLFEGFPVKIFSGLSVTAATLGFLATQWHWMFDRMEGLMLSVMKLMA